MTVNQGLAVRPSWRLLALAWCLTMLGEHGTECKSSDAFSNHIEYELDWYSELLRFQLSLGNRLPLMNHLIVVSLVAAYFKTVDSGMKLNVSFYNLWWCEIKIKHLVLCMIDKMGSRLSRRNIVSRTTVPGVRFCWTYQQSLMKVTHYRCQFWVKSQTLGSW